MTRLRFAAALAVVALAAPALAVPAASGDPGPGRFSGVDGLIYEYAPAVLEGPDGEYFLGADVDFACAVGRRLKVALRSLSKLAKVISTSGRRAVLRSHRTRVRSCPPGCRGRSRTASVTRPGWPRRPSSWRRSRARTSCL